MPFPLVSPRVQARGPIEAYKKAFMDQIKNGLRGFKPAAPLKRFIRLFERRRIREVSAGSSPRPH